MNITNIHLKKVDEENNAADSADITYKTWNETTKSFDEHTLKCDEAPNPSFVKGLQEGAKHVCALCELPATQAKEIVVTGLSLSHDKHGHARLSIKAWKHLEENGPLILNTPTAPVTAEKEDAHTVSDACAKWVDKVCQLAIAYVNGDRQQGTLPFKEGEGDQPELPSAEAK